MGHPILLFQRHLTPDKLLRATSHDGGRMIAPFPAASNTGSLRLRAGATVPTSVIDSVAEIVTEGDLRVGNFKFSADGGSTYKGRKVITTFDDGAGGGAGTSVVAYALTEDAAHSKAVPLDTNGDGVPDRAFIAVVVETDNRIAIIYTDDLDGATSWAVLNSDIYPALAGVTITAAAWGQIAMEAHGNSLFVVYRDLVFRSDDYGATWALVYTNPDTLAATYYQIHLVSRNGRLLMFYQKSDGSYTHVYCRSTSDGTAWSAANKVTSASADHGAYSVHVEPDDKVVVLATRLDTGAVVDRWCTANNPGTGSWTAGTDTFTTASPGYQMAAQCLGDGVTLVTATGVSGDVQACTKAYGGSTYAALADIHNTAQDYWGGRVSEIGGAVWCVTFNSATHDVEVILSRYWEAYSATNNEAPLGTDMWLGPDGVWYWWEDADGRIGDLFYSESDFANGGERMVAFTPGRPARSTGDGGAYEAVFDVGAGNVLPFDAWAVAANCPSSVQANDTDSWGSPSVNAAADLVEHSFTPDSVSGCLCVDSDAGRPPANDEGKTLRFDTSGNPYLIDANEADRWYCYDDTLTAETGAAKILGKKQWGTITRAAHRFIRLYVGAQLTVTGKYEVPTLAVGLRLDLRTTDRVYPTTAQDVEEYESRGGVSYRESFGEPIPGWTLVFDSLRYGDGILDRLKAEIEHCRLSEQAFILIPDSDDTTYFDVVRLERPSVSWASDGLALRLVSER